MPRRRDRAAVRLTGVTIAMPAGPQPIVERYRHCILKLACTGAELEPLRRTAGVCALCMRERMAKVKPAPFVFTDSRSQSRARGAKRGTAEAKRIHAERRAWNSALFGRGER